MSRLIMQVRNIHIFVLLLISVSASMNDLRAQDILELSYPKELKVVKRSDWGSVPIDTSFQTHEIQFVTIHHGGIEFPKGKDPVASIQNLQEWSRSEKNWIDIPYHFMIDLEGNIYEGRPINIPGDTNTEYDPTGHALIELMGNYEIQIPNESQLSSIVNLSRFLMTRFDVPPDKFKSHKDYSKVTLCPGKNLYEYFTSGYFEKAFKN